MIEPTAIPCNNCLDDKLKMEVNVYVMGRPTDNDNQGEPYYISHELALKSPLWQYHLEDERLFPYFILTDKKLNNNELSLIFHGSVSIGSGLLAIEENLEYFDDSTEILDSFREYGNWDKEGNLRSVHFRNALYNWHYLGLNSIK